MLHHLVTRERRVPVWRHQLGLVELADRLFQGHRTRHVPAGDHIFLTELGQQDLAIALPVTVVRDPDEAVLVLHAVGIRDTAAFIEKEAFVPSRAVIGGQPCGDVAAPFELVMVHEEQAPGGKATDEEARSRVGDGAGGCLAPVDTFVRGMALPKDATARAGEKPQSTVAQFGDHAFECPLRGLERAVKFPGPAFIGRDPNALKLLWAREPVLDRLNGMSHRHDPFAGGKHRGLVHAKGIRALVPDAELRTEHGWRGVGIVADASMDIMHGGVLVAAIEDVPQPLLRIDPQGGVETPRAILRRCHHLR